MKTDLTTGTNSEHTYVCITNEELLELERQLRALTCGDADQVAYAGLVFRHTASAARGPAMETDKDMYGRLMSKAALNYPIACVEKFFDQWRSGPGGRWWPTESDLIRGCEAQVGIWRNRHKRVLAEIRKRPL